MNERWGPEEVEKQELRGALRARFANLPEEVQTVINNALIDSGIIAWTIDELLPASVLIRHSFELKNSAQIYQKHAE